MSYLLNTCIVSAFFRKSASLIEKLEKLTPDDIKISTITLMEIEYGLQLNPPLRSKIQPIWHSLKSQVEIIPFSQDDAIHAAHIRSVLKKEGRLIGPYDILLAGTSKNHKLIFVTDNVAEFKRIEDLRVENWIRNH
jgi:tRNA(fMet)-specific endonuclease VapC